MKGNGKHLLLLGVVAAVAVVVGLVISPGLAEERKAPNAENGERVFNEFCAACHNRLEKVGSYLVDDTAYFINAGVPPQAIGSLYRHPVRNRPQGSRMPAFTPDEISDADLDDMGLYLAGKIPTPKTQPKLGSAERGTKPYEEFCASCHGARGEGVDKMMPLAIFANQLKKGNAPPNVMLGFVMLASRSGSVPKMPTYSPETLSDSQLANIAAHIWSMPLPSPPAQEQARPQQH